MLRSGIIAATRSTLSVGHRLTFPSYETVQITSLASAWHPPAAAAGRTVQSSAPQLCRGFASQAVAKRGTASRGHSSGSSGGSTWASGLLLLPPAVAALLGKWQLDRRRWKMDLLQRREDMLKGEPIYLFAMEQAPAEYQRVRVTGRFDHARTMYVGPRVRNIVGKTEQGYLAVTPLHSTEHAERAVLVNRGWVPAAWREHAEAEAAAAAVVKPSPASQPAAAQEAQGELVTIEGVVRCGEVPGSFVPPNDSSGGNWFYFNPGELASAAGLPAGAPLVEVISNEDDTKLVFPGGPPTAMEVLGGRGSRPNVEEIYPLPKSAGDLMAFSVMPSGHANYAATWFTLSGATAALAVKAIRQARRR